MTESDLRQDVKKQGWIARSGGRKGGQMAESGWKLPGGNVRPAKTAARQGAIGFIYCAVGDRNTLP
jgi:hypothetical protein